jgi:hypothetical protein
MIQSVEVDQKGFNVPNWRSWSGSLIDVVSAIYRSGLGPSLTSLKAGSATNFGGVDSLLLPTPVFRRRSRP